jgi:KipI family sensor histidine kinase inhibitor
MEPDTYRSIVPQGETALLVEFGPVSHGTTRKARQLADIIGARRISGVHDVVPAYRTVLIRFDPLVTNASAVHAALQRVYSEIDMHPAHPTRIVELHVNYGGAEGPDLDDVARHTGLSCSEVIRRHSAVDYTVEFMGFSPGFPYLSGLDRSLATPRLSAPRTHVPAGSVGIAGTQTGFYPLSSPGGWRLIGRLCSFEFDPARPGSLPYRPGDTIRFIPAALHSPKSQAREQNSAITIATADAGFFPDCAHGERALRVLNPGTQATIQDLGRRGYAALGYASAGALDKDALIIANRLVGNDDGDAVIEVTNNGAFEAVGDIIFAVTGANVQPAIDGRPIDMYRAASLRHGMKLTLGPKHRGIRAYVSVDGGIDTHPDLGSRSTDLLAGIGGLHGRALRAGDIVPLRPVDRYDRQADRGFAIELAIETQAGPQKRVRVTWGPQAELFDENTRSAFLNSVYRVSPRSDRAGLRLDGAALQCSDAGNLASEGSIPGVIQVPPDGNPIVLLADCRAVGGYPKIAVVVDADLPLVGQAEPGSALRFNLVDLDTALQATRDAALKRDRLPLAPCPELSVRCLVEETHPEHVTWRCPRSQACLISQRCLKQDGPTPIDVGSGAEKPVG